MVHSPVTLSQPPCAVLTTGNLSAVWAVQGEFQWPLKNERKFPLIKWAQKYIANYPKAGRVYMSSILYLDRASQSQSHNICQWEAMSSAPTNNRTVTKKLCISLVNPRPQPWGQLASTVCPEQPPCQDLLVQASVPGSFVFQVNVLVATLPCLHSNL